LFGRNRSGLALQYRHESRPCRTLTSPARRCRKRGRAGARRLIPTLYCELGGFMADASASARQMAGDQAVDVTAAQSYRGLRGWIDTVDRLGELKRVSGAHWDVEMGAVTHMLTEKSGGTAPAILFDD